MDDTTHDMRFKARLFREEGRTMRKQQGEVRRTHIPPSYSVVRGLWEKKQPPCERGVKKKHPQGKARFLSKKEKEMPKERLKIKKILQLMDC